MSSLRTDRCQQRAAVTQPSRRSRACCNPDTVDVGPGRRGRTAPGECVVGRCRAFPNDPSVHPRRVGCIQIRRGRGWSCGCGQRLQLVRDPTGPLPSARQTLLHHASGPTGRCAVQCSHHLHVHTGVPRNGKGAPPAAPPAAQGKNGTGAKTGGTDARPENSIKASLVRRDCSKVFEAPAAECVLCNMGEGGPHQDRFDGGS